MKTERLVEKLVEAARQMGQTVRFERGRFRGGRCMVAGEEVIVLNKKHAPEVQLAILAESLRDLPTDTIYLKPAVRAALEEVWERHAPEDQTEETHAG